MIKGTITRRWSSGVEHSLSGLLLLLAALAVFDFGRMYYYQSRLQYAVGQATRLATASSVAPDVTSAESELSRTEAISSMIRQLSGLPQLGEDDIEIVSRRSDGTFSQGAGGPGDVVTVTVTYRVAILTPYIAAMFHDGVYECSTKTSFRNHTGLQPAMAPGISPAPPLTIA